MAFSRIEAPNAGSSISLLAERSVYTVATFLERGSARYNQVSRRDEAYLVSDSYSFVGIFWAVREKRSAAVLLDHRCPISDAEPYGDMLTCPHGHYEVWEQWKRNARKDQSDPAPLIATDEYEEWPRGRIVYSSLRDHFVLYADKQILNRPDLLTTIHERFGLPADRTQAKRDSHYVSTRRLDGQRTDSFS